MQACQGKPPVLQADQPKAGNAFMPLGSKTSQKEAASPRPVLESSAPTAALSDMTEQKYESIVPPSDRQALRKVISRRRYHKFPSTVTQIIC